MRDPYIAAGMPAVPTIPRRSRSRIWVRFTRLTAAIMLGCALIGAAPGVAKAEPRVGGAEVFWTYDWAAGRYSQTIATAGYVGEHCSVYTQNGSGVSDYLVTRLGEDFDTLIHPTLTQAFGSEPNPGIDGDPRVFILIYDFNDPRNDIDGFFDGRDIDPDGTPYSNRREIVYINSQALFTEPAGGPTLVAHEFTHLIVYYQDVMLDTSPFRAQESTWLTEGFATYGEYLVGRFDRVGSQVRAFTRNPNFGLTHWQGLRANYGASHLFMRYLAERKGSDFIRALVGQPLDSVAGINATLAAAGSFATFASLFDDWVIAGLLDGVMPRVEPYHYSDLSVGIQPEAQTGVAPWLGDATVVDYGAVYVDFPSVSPSDKVYAVIDGETGAPLQAALVSWRSAGTVPPVVTRFDLANEAVGGTVGAPPGYDRHTLVVWARGVVGSAASFAFTYSLAPDPPGDTQFLDMGGSDHFYTYVAALLERGVISGKEIPPGSRLWFFMGAENVLRAQFAKMIMLATGLHTPDVDNVGNPTFRDVLEFDASGYPYDYVEEAAALGIVNGFSDGRFRPYSPITRGQLVLMITRGAAAAGRPLPSYTGSAKVFADVPLSHPYYRQIMTAYSAGILSGSVGANGRLYFHPYSSASRNHVAKMTANLIEHLEAQ